MLAKACLSSEQIKQQRQHVLDSLLNIIHWFLDALEHGNVKALQEMKRSVQKGDMNIFMKHLEGEIFHDIDAKPFDRKLSRNIPLQLLQFWSRIVIIIDILHEAKQNDVKINQRELYYQVKHMKVFQSYYTVCNIIQHISIMTSVSKSSLGIITSTKGLVYGHLIIRRRSCMDIINCSQITGYNICGDSDIIMDDFTFECSAKCIIVVEKETVFVKLKELGVLNSVRCILITAKGYPDVATRCFLKQLTLAFPSLPVLGLVDCNPDGLKIFSMYKFGNPTVQSDAHCVHHMAWLGLYPSEARNLGLLSCAFTTRDFKILENVMKQFSSHSCEEYLDEMNLLCMLKKKADIESIYSRKTLLSYLQSKLASM